MKIKTITLGRKATISLPGYNNIGPSLSMTAEVEEGENWEDAVFDLKENFIATFHEVVDVALEENGQPPKYYEGQRYRLLKCDIRKIIVVLPQDMDAPYGLASYYVANVASSNIRYLVAKRIAEKSNRRMILVTQEDHLSEIPPLHRIVIRFSGQRHVYSSEKFATIEEAMEDFKKAKEEIVKHYGEKAEYCAEFYAGKELTATYPTDNYEPPEDGTAPEPEDDDIPFDDDDDDYSFDPVPDYGC